MSNYVDANFTKKHLADGRTKVVNVLSAGSYEQKHLPGSINIPEEDPQFADRVQQLLPDKSVPVIVHCSSMDCQASTRAAKKLEGLGYKEVHDFKAGLEGWEQGGNQFAVGKEPGALTEPPTPQQQAEKPGDKTVERPPRPGREQQSHREEARVPEVKTK
jgi:rhodanese-related sulfurtransferase